MNLRDALAYEERNMGSPIHLLDHQRLKGKILAVLYYMDSEEVPDLGILRSYRLVTFQSEFLMSSFIVKSVWLNRKEP